MRIQPKKWEEFQHYKDRDPLWIKLHRRLLDNYEFHCLPVASRALAPMLWLLASEYKDGIIDATPEKISFRLRLTVKELISALDPLISSDFFVVYQDASNALADSTKSLALARSQETEKETETYKQETEKETDFRAKSFNDFWDAFDYKKGRDGALKSWNAIKNLTPELVDRILAGARLEAFNRQAVIARGSTPIYAQGWLSQKRWEDEHVETPVISRREAVNRSAVDGFLARLEVGA